MVTRWAHSCLYVRAYMVRRQVAVGREIWYAYAIVNGEKISVHGGDEISR